MDRALAVVDRILGAIAEGAVRISCVFLVLMFALTNIEVFGRYLVGYSTLIADEYVSYFFVWMAFLGFTVTMRNGQFLRVEAVLRLVHGRSAQVLQGIASLLSAGLCGVLVYCSGHTAWMSYRFNSASLQISETPLFVPQLIMPLGMALLALAFLHEGLVKLRHRELAGKPS